MHIPKKRFLILFFFILGAISLWYFNVLKYLSLEWLQTHRDYLQYLVREHYVDTVIGYISLYILVTALGVPITLLLTMLGGYLFNVLPGILYINIGATIGASAAFLAARYLVGVWVQRKYQVQLRALNHALKNNGHYYLLISRLSPVPFFIENLVVGLTRVPLTTFIWTTALGIIPGSIVYAYAGKQLMSLESLNDIISLPVIIAFFLISLLLLIPLLIQKQRN